MIDMADPKTKFDRQTELVSNKTPIAEPYFSYDSLPEGWIRLLRINDLPYHTTYYSPYFTNEVTVSIYEYPLQSCPSYVALSYTWGEALQDAGQSPVIFTTEGRCYPISCKNRLLRCTRNLRDALRHLREAQYIRRLEKDRQSSTFQEHIALWSDFYWIDALCIDQDDLEERSTQVRMMGDIYRRARTCTIWLGEEDEHTKVFYKVSSQLCEDEQTRSIRRRGENQAMIQETFNNFAWKLNEQEKISVMLFLSRRWFSRLWVLQEAVLAPNAIMMCGAYIISLSEILFLATVFRVSGAWFTLKTTLPTVPPSLRSKQSRLESLFEHSMMTLESIATARMKIQDGAKLGLMQIMNLGKMCQATDDRDKIYGILGFTAEMLVQEEPNTKFEVIIDYTIPVERLYRQATFAIARRLKSLEFLSLVCNRKQKKYQSLPSWCPDYSVATRLINGWGNATTGISWGSFWSSRKEPDIGLQDENFISVEGFCYDLISEVAKQDHSCGDNETVPMASSILRLAVSPRNDTGSRVHSLWRLLMKNEFALRSPAPVAAGLFFPVMIVHMFLMGVKYNSGSLGFGSTADLRVVAEMELKQLEEVIKQIEYLEPQSLPFLPDMKQLRYYLDEVLQQEPLTIDALLPGISNCTNNELFNFQERARISGLNDEALKLLGWESWERDFDKYLTRLARFFTVNILPLLTKALMSKCYFSTIMTHRLGFGYDSIKSQDQVWFLHGFANPVILKPLGHGRYEFCGEACIYGIMIHELTRISGSKSDKIRKILIE